MCIKLTMHVHLNFFQQSANFILAFRKHRGFEPLLKLISARSEFDTVIYFDFCSFWVSFIYWC